MITQSLMDMISQVLAYFVNLLPPLPDSWDSAFSAITHGYLELATPAADFGIVIPWIWLYDVSQWWVALLVFWAAVLAIRVVVWIFNR